MSDARVKPQGAPYDVAIIGGGLVGASLAVALAPLSLRVILIEAAPPPAFPPSWDERCIAINDASYHVFASLGVWPQMSAAATPITATHISERGRFGVARFSAEEAGLPALGYNIPFRHVGAVLWRAMQDTPTELICPARLQSLSVDMAQVRLTLDDGRAIETRLVVAADGAQSVVRGLLGLTAETLDYRQSAIVTAVRPVRPHHGVAYERFTPEGPFAVLPKPDNACSMVWTVPTEKVADMLAWTDAVFLREAQDMFGERLGRFLELGRRNAHPLQRVMNETLTAPRTLFIGNAAQALHPVAAQGFNLGLRDVAAVAEVLAAGVGDCGASAQLDEYGRRRAQDRQRMAEFTDRLVRTFSNRIPGLRGLRHLGLLALDLTPGLKTRVMRQSLGYAGITPALARTRPTPAA
ncbi:MAG TPA: 2-octaprenyl-6-methoxyphenyl hydroxylase [Stenotrophobium sp.]|nr:2-octaprenyl-6-methoxyphenyl hydroxylase [Stenotrophobium sp.]